MRTNSLVLGGGCFWCLDAAFRLVPGVAHVVSGYAGGAGSNPSYEAVCSGLTGHAEVVKIDFDPEKVSLDRLLQVFWEVHDPTQVGGQGHDIGTQYRSVLYYQSDEEKRTMEASRDREQKGLSRPIATELAPLPVFWPAEAYHQDYFNRNPDRGYCAAVIRPKVRHIQELLAQRA